MFVWICPHVCVRCITEKNNNFRVWVYLKIFFFKSNISSTSTILLFLYNNVEIVDDTHSKNIKLYLSFTAYILYIFIKSVLCLKFILCRENIISSFILLFWHINWNLKQKKYSFVCFVYYSKVEVNLPFPLSKLLCMIFYCAIEINSGKFTI